MTYNLEIFQGFFHLSKWSQPGNAGNIAANLPITDLGGEKKLAAIGDQSSQFHIMAVRIP